MENGEHNSKNKEESLEAFTDENVSSVNSRSGLSERG
jgi:hypothetical protein